MRLRFLPVLLLALPSAAAAQEDVDLANGLVDRGWYDLAKEIYESLPSDRATEGKYGLARMKMNEAERATNPEEKMKLYDSAIADIQAFIDKNPSHPRASEAYGDIGYLHQSKGKTLMGLAKLDPAKSADAEKAFQASEGLFLRQVEALNKVKPPFPENPKGQDDPGIRAYFDWEQKLVQARYNHLVSLFSHGETYRDTAAKRSDMQKQFDEMKKVIDELQWLEGNYVYPVIYDAFIYMGRAHQILAETANDPVQSRAAWNSCFANIGKAQSLLDNKEYRGYDDIRDVAARSAFFEIKAHFTYALTLGSPAPEYLRCVKVAEELFKKVPVEKNTNTGKSILIEQARAYGKLGDLAKAKKILDELIRANPGTWVEDLATDLKGLLFGEKDPVVAMNLGDSLFERGPAYHPKAIQAYRLGLSSAVPGSPDELKLLSRAWFGIGRCFYYQNRYFEAAAALAWFDDAKAKEAPDAKDAVLLKASALKKIELLLETPEAKRRSDQYKDWAEKTYPGIFGEDATYSIALERHDEAEKLRSRNSYAEAAAKYAEAVKTLEKILAKPESSRYEEALFWTANCHYHIGVSKSGQKNDPKLVEVEKKRCEDEALAAYRKALKFIADHLALVEKPDGKLRSDPKVIRRAVGGSLLFAIRAHLTVLLRQPAEALTISADVVKRFPNADPSHLIAVLRWRVKASLDLDKLDEAETELRALKATFDKHKIGLDHYSGALVLLWQYCDDKSKTEKDPEKSAAIQAKSAQYYFDAINADPSIQPRSGSDPTRVAATFYEQAESQTKAGKTREAQENYRKAAELYDKFYREKEMTLSDSDKKKYRLRIAYCLMRGAKIDDARKVYEEMVAEDEKKTQGATWEAYADALMEIAGGMPSGSERTALLRKADEEVYAWFSAVLLEAGRQDENYYRLLYKHADALYQYDWDKLGFFFKTMDLKGYAPKWDEDPKSGQSRWGFRDKFEELRKKAQEKLPSKR